MNIHSITSILLLGLVCVQLTASAQSFESKLESVTVYRQGAREFRTAEIRVPAGSHDVVLSGLPASIVEQSIQVEAPASLVLLSVGYRLNHLAPQQATREIKVLQDSIEGVQIELQKLQNRIYALTQEEAMILANKQIGGSNTGVPLSALSETATFFRKRLTDLRDEQSALQRQEKKVRERLTAHQQQLNQKQEVANRPTGELVLQVQGNSATNGKVTFSFLVPEASWQPTYDIRASETGGPVTLSYRAMVSQQTGMDWKEVKLAINTGNPYMSNDRPILRPWFINFSQPRPMSRDKVESLSNIYLPPPAQMEDAAGAGLTVADFTTVEEGQTSNEFQIDLKYTVPSGGRPIMVAMKDYELPTVYQYHVVPKLDRDAFLLGKLTGWVHLGLLPGPASIFMGTTYTGQTILNPRIAADTLYISFGRDSRINVTREVLTEFTSRRFLGANKRETFGYEIKLRNNRTTSAEVEVLENIPISQNNEIEVTLDNAQGAEHDAETGRLLWRMTLQPGESRSLRFSYTVRYPRNKTIPNL